MSQDGPSSRGWRRLPATLAGGSAERRGTAVWLAHIRSATSPRHPGRKAPRANEAETGEGPQVVPRGGNVDGRGQEWWAEARLCRQRESRRREQPGTRDGVAVTCLLLPGQVRLDLRQPLL